MLLKKGSKGKEVLFLQYGLHILCFLPKGFDSIFGINTEKAVKSFQKEYGLVVDGCVGDKTWGKIKKEIVYIQKAIKKEGIDIGSIDGIPGEKTYKGILEFQKRKGLKVDGIVGEKTRKALFSSNENNEIVKPENQLKNMTIFIDPGHGGKDSGAVGNNIKEKDVVLKLSLILKRLLKEEGFKVILSRESDIYLSLEDRAIKGNRCNCDLFLSLHCNASLNKKATGTECFIHTNGSKRAKEYGEKIVKEVSKNLGLSNRGVKRANFAVLRLTSMPAVLIETAFISNYEDSIKLRGGIDKFAIAILSSIKDKY